MRDWLKRRILDTAALRLAARLRGPGVAILMYHSVLPDPSVCRDSLGGIIHSEDVFRGQMEALAKHFHPVSLARVLKYLRGGETLPKRAVVVTFDDGYADNYLVAMPVLDKVGVPATFYITVDCLESRILPWPSRLRYAFRTTKRREWVDSTPKTWSLNDRAAREQAFLAACDEACQLSGAPQAEFVTRIEQELEACLPKEFGALMMDYEQLRALVRHGHIVGSHTMTHPNMGYLKEHEAMCELQESKRRLEAGLGSPMRHFSYPCPALSPHWTPTTVEQCRIVGYETAVTTENGVARKGDNPLCLKRLRPTKTVEGLRWNLESALAGHTG